MESADTGRLSEYYKKTAIHGSYEIYVCNTVMKHTMKKSNNQNPVRYVPSLKRKVICNVIN